MTVTTVPATKVQASARITEKQVLFIHALLDSRIDPADPTGSLTAQRHEALNTGVERGTVSKKWASGKISEMQGWAKKSTPAPVAQDVSDDIQGMHRVGEAIYKVQKAIHGSGKLYAKALVSNGRGGWEFTYAPGIIRQLSAITKMTLEQAKEFGALYGTCCVCGKTLTDENSIEAGIGPVCAKKF